MKYAILQATGEPHHLETKVDEFMKAGWRCQGGVAIVDMGNVVNVKRLGYVQAMVKED
jgi:hypothetical protein